MGLALAKLAEEDPTFKTYTDEETGQTIIAGMGELHLEIIVDRLLREFKVEANVGKPQVSYKEAIRKTVKQEHKYARQSGGKGQYGHVKIRIKPLEELPEDAELPKNVKRDEGFEFINNIKGGVIPNEFIPAVEKGVKEALERGTVAGYKMVNVSVELFDGSAHDVDSSEIAFKLAGINAFQEAAEKADSVLLEPIMKVEITTPEQFMGDITGNISSKRGHIESMEDREMVKVVNARVPLSEMFGYTTTLRSMTEGRASMTMEFDHYEVVPPNVAADIKAARNA